MFFNNRTSPIGIELGTANTIVVAAGNGIVFDEPTICCFEGFDAAPRLVAAGEEASRYVGRIAKPLKIVRPLRMDDRTLMRFQPGYAVTQPGTTALDWSDWGGFGPAVEMCNSNVTCRKLAGGAMCPSYRVTGEDHRLDVRIDLENTPSVRVGVDGDEVFTWSQ